MTAVSVALCTYNGERYLPQLLDSLVAQERRPDELVVCDDRSADDTVPLLERFAARAPFPVRLHVNDRNLGTTKNFELAIERCTGDLISLCDQDDIWLPKKLMRALEAFEADPTIGYSFSDAELIDDDSRPLDRTLWDAVGFGATRRASASAGRLLPMLVLYTFVTGTAMTFRSDLRKLVLPIPHAWFHDAWIALVASFVRSYRMLEEPLLLYRLHGDQQIGVPPVAMPDDTALLRWKARLTQAPEKVNLRMSDLHRQRRRMQAMLYDAVAERVEAKARVYEAESGGRWQPLADEALADVKQRAEHLRLRGSLPDNRIKRLPAILREVRTGRYARYSAGTLSAVQDAVS